MAQPKTDKKKPAAKKLAKKVAPKDKNLGGRPSLYKTAEQLSKAISQYLDDATPKPVMTQDAEGHDVIATDRSGNPVYTQVFPTIAGLAYALGYVSRQSVYDLGKDERYSYILKRAVLYIESLREQNLALRDKPTGDIFWLKNHGWRDKPEDDSGLDDKLEVIINDRRNR